MLKFLLFLCHFQRRQSRGQVIHDEFVLRYAEGNEPIRIGFGITGILKGS